MSASGAILYKKFTTRAFASGLPTTLSGSPVVSVYKDGSTTQSVAGVSLTVDFDGVAGLNHVTIDTGADGTFYANGSHFDLVITTGTVGGTSVIGEAVGEFDLSASSTFPTNFSLLSIDGFGRVDVGKILGTASAGAAGYVGIDWAHVNAPTTTVALTNTTVGTTTNLTNLPTIPANWITAAGIAADAIGASELATDAVTEIAGGMLNAVAASYNTAGTIGAKINSASGGGTITADITSINGTTFTGPNLPAVLADGVAHGGTPGSSTATLAMERIWVESASASHPAVLFRNTAGNDAFDCFATGSGGYGFYCKGTDAYAVAFEGTVSDPAQYAPALLLQSRGTDVPIVEMTGLSAVSGDGVSIKAHGHGINVIVDGTGSHGILSTGGTDGDGFHGVGAGTGVGFRSAPDAVGFGAGTTVVSFSSAALAQFFTLDTGEKYAAPYSDAVPGSVVYEIVSNAGIDEARLLTDIDAQLSGTHGAGAWGGSGAGGLDAAGIRNAIGMATNNLDVQLAAIKSEEDSISSTLTTVAGDVTTILTQTSGGLDAAGIRAAIGMATANLDGQLAGLDAHILSRLAASAYVVPLDAIGIRNAIGLATNNLDVQLGNLPSAAQNADKLLGRNIEGGSDSGRVVREALYFLRNKWTIIGGTLTVYAANDSSVAWTGGVSQANVTPVTGIDPA